MDPRHALGEALLAAFGPGVHVMDAVEMDARRGGVDGHQYAVLEPIWLAVVWPLVTGLSRYRAVMAGSL
jgi:hypothetical protein